MPPELHFVDAGDARVAVWEWPGDDPPLLLAHATGFHGHSWDHILQRMPPRHAYALDFRGHGRSSKPEPPIPWSRFARDLLAVARRFDIRDAIGVGHSMGGHSLVEAAIQAPAIFSALLLVDPVIFPPVYYGAPPPDASYILRRRNSWKSPAEMFERFRPRAPFVTWTADALRDYCEYALLPAGDAYVLACPPAVEASIYQQCNAPEANLYAGIPTVAQPVTILRAPLIPHEPGALLNLNGSPTAPDLASQFPHGRDVFLPNRNHYIPMEAPELVVAEIDYFWSNKSGR